MKDMYGHEIVPIGDGFGVSVTFGVHSDGAVDPLFSVFHSSDGFRQSLFSVDVHDRPQVYNVFEDRLREVLAVLKAWSRSRGTGIVGHEG